MEPVGYRHCCPKPSLIDRSLEEIASTHSVLDKEIVITVPETPLPASPQKYTHTHKHTYTNHAMAQKYPVETSVKQA